MKETNIPLITCNINSTEEPEFAKAPFKPSIVIERGGQKFGIIGYVTTATAVSIFMKENII